jgi:hypothetical protein
MKPDVEGYSPDNDPALQNKQEEMPAQLTEITPYENARLVDAAYEDPKILQRLSVDELQTRMDQYEHMPEYKKYLRLHMNFDILEKMVQEFEQFAKKNSAEQLSETLKGHVKTIQYAVNSYYKTVMVFDRTSIKKFLMEPAEYQEEMSRIDRKRTADHNTLIDAVIILTRMCYREIPEKTGYKFDKSQLFDPNLIHDLRSSNKDIHRSARDKIANWAFLNERGFHIVRTKERVEGLLKEKKSGSGKSETA